LGCRRTSRTSSFDWQRLRWIARFGIIRIRAKLRRFGGPLGDRALRERQTTLWPVCNEQATLRFFGSPRILRMERSCRHWRFSRKTLQGRELWLIRGRNPCFMRDAGGQRNQSDASDRDRALGGGWQTFASAHRGAPPRGFARETALPLSGGSILMRAEGRQDVNLPCAHLEGQVIGLLRRSYRATSLTIGIVRGR
jgi:hypothetical protein